uniref:Growth-regulating factor n=1 Tax=Oryza punctata TaxID=4537 RepID=A0A0E0L734_ORYPU
MATRNRTPLYRKYRDALRHVRAPAGAPSSSSSSGGGGGGGPVIEMASLLRSDRPYAPLSTDDPSAASSRGAVTVGLPPAWVDVSEEISANMQRARTKMAELAKAHAKALMPSFGDGRDDQRAIEILTHEVTDLLKKSEKRLQKLSMKDSSEDSNVRKNVQRSLATDLQSLSMEFRKKQSTYLKQLRQQKEGQDGVDLEMNMNGSKSTFELGDDEFEDVGFTEVQMSKLKKSEAFTREREREIEQVVESVNELAQIMKDLSVLVIDQGTIIDRIDYNIQNVAASVEEGYKQLQKAERTQKKGGMVMCATTLVSACMHGSAVTLVFVSAAAKLEVSYYAYYGKKLDPEPWRCRRTDGKKWRCSKEAHPDSKYCERHMHRGRNRSRKPVESKTAAPAPQSQPQLSNVTTATHDADAPLPSLTVGAKTHGLSLGGAGSSQFHVDAPSYGSKYSLGAKADVGELSFFSGASGNTRGFTIDSPTDSSWHSLPSSVPPYPMSKPRDSGLLPGAYSYSHLEPSQELGQVTIASLSQEQERRSFGGGAGGMLGNVKHENQPLRPFFDEWPGRRDSWSEMDEERSNQTSFSTTQLSISIPMPRYDERKICAREFQKEQCR